MLTSPKGKSVRMDFTRVTAEAADAAASGARSSTQTPFERILAEAVTSLELAPADGGTRVTIALEQKPRGWARFAPLQFRAAGTRQVQGALDGLERLFA